MLVIACVAAACSSPGADAAAPIPTRSLPAVDRALGAGARAALNEDTGEVVLPMSAYWYSDRENVLVNYAVAFLIYDCVEEAGFTLAPWGGDGKALQERRYGQWSGTLAAKNGNMPEVRSIPGLMPAPAERTAPSPERERAEAKCSNTVGRAGFPELLEGLAGDLSVQQQITQDAVGLTARDPEYLAYRESWQRCLTDKGLKLRDGDTWIVESGGSKEDEIRVALLDVDCKDSSGGARKPYDILAQYQAALMKEHQAELNVVAEQKTAAVERAKQVLRDHGVADARL
ncbi:hypothetical protein AAU01_26050 [Paenarthrobacter aurescens]|uniref:Lipoprotein n=1 Tax=Paenarthrobacter aurescens TaxID=43663 RepID=A0A4Y3NDG1_PAEAU|nr:hypothetical protein AAU01_26050 [Paenarthrobacter aurescens]